MSYQRLGIGMLVAGLCAAADSPARLEPPTPESAGEYRIRTNVDRVVLPVTVVDRKGELVPGLAQQDFAVYEDGRPQHIRSFFYRDVPVTVGLVIDGSSSMLPKRGNAILAALHFLRLSNPADEVFLVSFNEKVYFGLPEATPFSGDPSRLREALLAFPSRGRTALYDGVAAALRHLARGSRDKKALVVVSDGGDNASISSFRQLLDAVQRSDAIVYTIALLDERDSNRNIGVLKKLARSTGGEAFLPLTAAELPGICEHVAGVLRSQYTVGYAPANENHDGAYRRIEVVATAPGSGRKLVVRTRSGYYAPLDEPAAKAVR
jgi:Ca-activated chloride channel family protein